MRAIVDGPAIVDDYCDNSSLVKNRQYASQSLGDRPTAEDHPHHISTTSNRHDTNRSLGDPLKDSPSWDTDPL